MVQELFKHVEVGDELAASLGSSRRGECDKVTVTRRTPARIFCGDRQFTLHGQQVKGGGRLVSSWIEYEYQRISNKFAGAFNCTAVQNHGKSLDQLRRMEAVFDEETTP